jgi:hypothetical protein
MFDPQKPGSGPVGTIPIPGGTMPSPLPVPLERLEAQICQAAP